MNAEDVRDQYLRMHEEAMEDLAELGLTPDSLYDYDDGPVEEETFITSEDLAKDRKRKEIMEQRKTGKFIPPDNPDEIEEQLHFKRFRVQYERKYTEKEMEEIKASNLRVYVNDYGPDDIYHESDEEREEKNVLREIQPLLNGNRHSYTKVDQYIRAMRIVVKAWELLESRMNHVHTKEEFFRLVGEGHIVSSSIIMPQLRGMKKYNQERLMQYISDETLDPSRLVEETKKDWYAAMLADEDWEELEEVQERVLTDEQRQYLIDHEEEPEEMEVQLIPANMIKGYDSRKGKKEVTGKKARQKEYRRQGIHSLLKKIQNDPNNHVGSDYNRSLLLTHSLFGEIKEEADPFDDVYFTGSWADKNAVRLNDLALRERLLQTRPVGSQRTYASLELQDFFNALERVGLNVLELRRRMNADPDTLKTQENKRTKKENAKIEKALIARITAMNQSPKFKKVVAKAEKAINEQFSEQQ